jgi:fructokinase
VNATALVVGEALVDVVLRADGTVTRSPGGSPANVAVTLGRLGLPVRLLTQLADDADGLAVRSWLTASGVRVVSQPPYGRTSTATASLASDGSATYQFDIEWSLSKDLSVNLDVDLVHVGSLGAMLTPGADVVEALVADARPTIVTYDPNIRPALVDDPEDARARVQRMVSAARVVKASEDDLAWLYPDDDVATIARKWCATGPDLVVITLGAAGALAVTHDHAVRMKGTPADVVDTVAAGDTFMGTLIAELVAVGMAESQPTLDRPTIEHVLHRCANNAAITVSRAGADPPWAHELPGNYPFRRTSG